jgi:hypothetical protein
MNMLHVKTSGNKQLLPMCSLKFLLNTSSVLIKSAQNVEAAHQIIIPDHANAWSLLMNWRVKQLK